MGRIKGRTAAATRQETLVAATTAFAQFGYQGASLASIAAEIGVTPATISYHFGGKEPLYDAVIDRVYAELAALREELRPGLPLEQVIAVVWDFVADRPHAMRLLLRNVVESGGVGDKVRNRQMGPALDLASAVLANLQKTTPLRARRTITALTHLVMRFSTNSEADNRVALGTDSDEATRHAILNILCTTARALFSLDHAE